MNKRSLRSVRRAFLALEPPDAEALVGTYRGELVGPPLLRRLSGLLLDVTVLRGWWGKEFPEPGRCDNLVSRRGSIRRVLPVDVVTGFSLMDGKPAICLAYAPDGPWPYRWYVDELRQTPDGSLLGMFLPARRWLPRIALPFMLHPVEQGGG